MYLDRLKYYDIILVTDEFKIQNIFKKIFYQVYEVNNEKSAYDIYLINKPEILFIDIDIPNFDGLKLAKKIKEINYNTIIIVASNDISDKNLFFTIKEGLNDFIVKPYNIEELLASLNKIAISISQNSKEYIQLKNNRKIDLNNSLVISKEKEEKLTKKELKIINLLLNKNTFVSKEEIEIKCWGYGEVKDSSLRSFICRLRNKIGKDSLISRTGFGYKLLVD